MSRRLPWLCRTRWSLSPMPGAARCTHGDLKLHLAYVGFEYLSNMATKKKSSSAKRAAPKRATPKRVALKRAPAKQAAPKQKEAAVKKAEKEVAELLAEYDGGGIDNAWDVIYDLQTLDKRLPKTSSLRKRFDAMFAEMEEICREESEDD
jgi:hypothetical protein